MRNITRLLGIVLLGFAGLSVIGVLMGMFEDGYLVFGEKTVYELMVGAMFGVPGYFLFKWKGNREHIDKRERVPSSVQVDASRETSKNKGSELKFGIILLATIAFFALVGWWWTTLGAEESRASQSENSLTAQVSSTADTNVSDIEIIELRLRIKYWDDTHDIVNGTNESLQPIAQRVVELIPATAEGDFVANEEMYTSLADDSLEIYTLALSKWVLVAPPNIEGFHKYHKAQGELWGTRIEAFLLITSGWRALQSEGDDTDLLDGLEMFEASRDESNRVAIMRSVMNRALLESCLEHRLPDCRDP